MPPSDFLHPSPRLTDGTVLGPQTVLSYVRTEPFGERYLVRYGTLSHTLDLFVPPAADAQHDAQTAQRYEQLVDLSNAVRQCRSLGHYFTCGVDDGIPWMRTDHLTGITESDVHTALSENWPVRDEDDEAFVQNLQEFLEAAKGPIHAKERDRFTLDIFEAVAVLHKAGIPAPSLLPADIPLNMLARSRRASARVVGWAPAPEGASMEALVRRDREAAARALKTLAEASEHDHARRAILRFAQQLSEAAFSSSEEAYNVLYAALIDAGSTIPDERDNPFLVAAAAAEEAAAAADAAQSAAASGTREERRRRSSHHHHRSRRHHQRERSRLSMLAESGSETARRLLLLFRMSGLILLLAGFGVGGYYFLMWGENRARASVAFHSSDSYSAFSYIPIREDGSDAQTSLENIPADVFLQTIEQSERAARNGDVLADIKLAYLPLLSGTNSVITRAEAAPIADAFSRHELFVRDSARTSRAAAFFLGYEQLLGLLGKPNLIDALFYLQSAADDKLPYASLLLGDWFASDAPLPNSAPHGRAERDRQAITHYRNAAAAATAMGEPVLRDIANTRAVCLLRLNRDITAGANDYMAYARELAQSGHICAMALLAEPGGIVEEDPTLHLTWLRTLSNRQDAVPAVRGWAQVRMAQRYRDGNGTPQSDDSAKTWFERAADCGNETAIRALLEYLRAEGDEEAVARWTERLQNPIPEPDFFTLHPLPISVTNAP